MDDTIRVGWMTRGDRWMVAAISASTDYPLSAAGVGLLLRGRAVVGRVAVDSRRRVLGYSVHQLGCGRVVVHALAVRRSARGRGVGRALAEVLTSSLGTHRRELVARVRETDVAGREFWRAMGASGVGVDRDWYESPREDAYRLVVAWTPIVIWRDRRDERFDIRI